MSTYDCPEPRLYFLWSLLADNAAFYNAFKSNPRQAVIDFALTDFLDPAQFGASHAIPPEQFPAQSDFRRGAMNIAGEFSAADGGQIVATQTYTHYLLVDGSD
ncbi:MAG: hypothetical protein AAF465_10470 [Pseudomonadota bacterium]